MAYTEAPENFKAFLKQRFRWTYGILQCVWKHRDRFLKKGSGVLGWVALPQALIFNFLVPLISPLSDFLLLYSILTGWTSLMIFYYIGFLVLDLLSAVTAFKIENEPLTPVWLVIPQRFVYRQLMYIVLYRSVLAAIRGSLSSWGGISRTGRVFK